MQCFGACRLWHFRYVSRIIEFLRLAGCTRRLFRVGVIRSQQLGIASSEHTAQCAKLNIGHEALPGFYPLYRIFVDVKPDKLELVRQLTLRDVQLFSESSNIFPANIVPIVDCLVNKHNNKVLQALRVGDRSRRRHLHFLRSEGRGNQTAAGVAADRDKQLQQQCQRKHEYEYKHQYQRCRSRRKALQQVGLVLAVPAARRFRCTQIL